MREQHGHLYVTMCETHSWWELLQQLRPVLGDDPEGWEVGGRRNTEGICVYL